MNNRNLAKFLDQAGLHVHAGYPQPDAIQKFAELIIKECQKSANQYISDCGEVNSLPETVFNKHFGV
jgi:hypothetical protein